MNLVSELTYSREKKPSKRDKQIAYKDLFDSPVGRIVLRDLISVCEASTTGTTNDGILNAYRSGRQDIIKYIEKLLVSELMKEIEQE